MARKTVLICYISSLVFIDMTVAMFFTDSKDNDYPRIGKRLLPVSTYTNWIAPQPLDYRKYDFGRDNRNVLRNILRPNRKEVLETFAPEKITDVPALNSIVPTRIGYNGDETRDLIMTYLNSDDDIMNF